MCGAFYPAEWFQARCNRRTAHEGTGVWTDNARYSYVDHSVAFTWEYCERRDVKM